MYKLLAKISRCCLVVVFFLSSIVGYAQPSPMRGPISLDSMYLLEIAQRLASRGEYSEAKDLLDKVKATDPGNQQVQELIKQINEVPSAAQAVPALPVTKTSDIASDIEIIQKHIQRNERKNRDLEFLVRQLVQENDLLAMTLMKRNRDYFELLKKVYGEGVILPELPIFHNIERNRQLMAEYQDDIVARDRQRLEQNQELSHVIQNINYLNESLKNSSRNIEDVENPEQHQSQLQAQPQQQEVSIDQSNENRKNLIEESLMMVEKSLEFDKSEDNQAPNASSDRSSLKGKQSQKKDFDEVKNINEQLQKSDEETRVAFKSLQMQKQIPEKEETFNNQSKEKDVASATKSIVSKENTSNLEKSQQKTVSPSGISASKQNQEKAQGFHEVKNTAELSEISDEKLKMADVQKPEQNQEKVQDTNEVKNDVTEPSKKSNMKMADAQKSEPNQPQADEKLNVQLKEKRADLLDKSIVLMEKSRDLEMLQKEMGRVSGVLKDSDEKYKSALKDYDVKIRDLKELWVKDKSKQQEQIYDLRDQLITKTKEIQRIQSQIVNQGPALEELKDKLTQKDQKITQMDTDILAKDKQIIKLKSMMVKNADQMALQKKKIAEQDSVLAMANDKADDLKKRVVRIRQSLSEGDGALDELKILITDLKARAQTPPSSRMPPEDPALRTELIDLKEQLRGTLQALQEKERTISDLKKKFNDDQKEVPVLKDEMPDFHQELQKKEATISDLQKKLSDYQKDAPALKSELIDSKQQLDGTNQELQKKEKMISDLQTRLNNYQNEGPALKSELMNAKEQLDGKAQELQEKDKTISDLKSKFNDYQNQGAALKSELTTLKQQLNETSQALQEKERTISDFKMKLNDYQNNLEKKNLEIVDQKQSVNDFEGQLKELKSSEAVLKNQIESNREKMAMLVDNANNFKASATTAAERADNLSQKVYDLENQLQDQMMAANQEMRFLKETLAQRDKDLVEIKKNLTSKDDNLKLFYQKMQEKTRALNAQSLSQDTTPTVPSWNANDKGSASDSSFEMDWDPKDNDVYSLQARLSIVTKELKFTRDQLTSQSDQLKEMEIKLAAKEQAWEQQKAVYMKLLAADDAIKQSKKMRIADAAIRSVELDVKMVRAQQELTLADEQLGLYKKNIRKLTDDLNARSKAMAQLTQRFQKRDQEIVDVKSQIKERNEQIEFQKEAIDHETEKFATLKKELDQSNKLVELGQNKFSNKDLSIQDLQDRLNNAQIREKGYKGQVDDIEGQLRQSYSMVKDSEQRIEDLKKQLADKEGRINILQNEMMHLKDRFHQKIESSVESEPAASSVKE